MDFKHFAFHDDLRVCHVFEENRNGFVMSYTGKAFRIMLAYTNAFNITSPFMLL